MPRRAQTFATALAAVLLPAAAFAAAPPQRAAMPVVYELIINGESFAVEGDGVTKCRSKDRAGVVYEVAVRVAPTQRLRLGNVVFDYDRQTKVEPAGNAEQPGFKLTHELGFTLLVGLLGDRFEAKDRDEALSILSDSAAATYKELKVAGLTVGQPHERKFAGAAGRGVVIRYRDPQDFGHTALVYVLVGPQFTMSCVAEYLDRDSDDVLPLLQRTLESFRPAP